MDENLVAPNTKFLDFVAFAHIDWEKETNKPDSTCFDQPSALNFVGFICFSIKLSYLNTIKEVF